MVSGHMCGSCINCMHSSYASFHNDEYGEEELMVCSVKKEHVEWDDDCPKFAVEKRGEK
jgi:hypothetical protein